MKLHAIIHSFHSQVYQTLAKLDDEPDVIVALDSHLDVYMGVKDVLDLMPEDVQLAAIRASAHTMIRRVLGDLPGFLKAKGLSIDQLPEMFLVVPQGSLNRYVFDQAQLLQEAILSGAVPTQEFREPTEAFLHYLSEVLGIKVYTSPPKNLLKLANMLKVAEYALLDLDVDYLHELQTECYTPIKAQPGELSWMERVLGLIRKTKPPLITISEAKVVAIRDPRSNFSKLMTKLSALGYKIKYAKIFASDEEAERPLKVYKDFEERIQKPLIKKQFADSDLLSSEAFERHHKELREATKRYFG